MKAKIYQTQVVIAEKVESLNPANWMPWRNSQKSDREVISNMALHKAIRERGGVLRGERLTAWVYVVCPGDPIHENGNPLACYSYQMKVSNPHERT